jgi:Salmonella virulence plasmid 65kDa B protein
MIVAPLEPAFAQTASTSGSTSSNTSTDVTTEIGPNQSTTGTSTGSPTQSATTSASTPTTGSANQPATNGDTNAPTSQTTNSTQSPTNTPAPAVGPAFTPGAQTGPDLQPVVYNSFNQNQLKIDQNTGALETTYPISIPPGRNGLQPDVDLVYSSQNSQQGSILGEGWSTSIPYISRLNKSGVDNLYSTLVLENI